MITNEVAKVASRQMLNKGFARRLGERVGRESFERDMLVCKEVGQGARRAVVGAREGIMSEVTFLHDFWKGLVAGVRKAWHA